MAATPTSFRVFWMQNGTQVSTVDMTQPATMIAKRVNDYVGFSFHPTWTGSPIGTLDVLLSNADQLGDAIVPPEEWVAVPPLRNNIGQGADPDTSPSLMELPDNRTGWVALQWLPASPGSNPGTLKANFSGIRR